MKKLLSLLLVLSLSVSLLSGSVLAVAGNNAPFELVAALNDEDKMVTLSLRTTGQLTFGNIDVQLDLDSIAGKGFSLTTIEQGNDYTEFNAAPPVSNVASGKASILSMNYSEGSTVDDSNKEFLLYKLDASTATSGVYTFSVQFTSAADIDGNELAWQGATIPSNEITIKNAGADPKEPVVRTIEPGDYGSTNMFVPYGEDFLCVQNELIYDKSSIAASGTITALAFQLRKNEETLATDFVKIYLGCTEKSTFETTGEWIELNTLEEVYSGAPTLGANPDEEGWETLTLGEPFKYDNSKNLVVAVYRVSSTAGSSMSLQFWSGYYSDGRTPALSCSSSEGDWTANDEISPLIVKQPYLPYIQFSFEPDACTHANATTSIIDNGDGTHTISKICDVCGAPFADITEEHTFDWEHAVLEGDQYTAVCTDCTAEASVSVAGKTPLKVTRATQMETGKVYVITEPDGAYAMAVTAAPNYNGTATFKVRLAVPVRVVNNTYVIFEDESAIRACQWDYVDGGRLRSYSEADGCDMYLYANINGPESLHTYSADDETDDFFEWTYSDNALTSVGGAPYRIVFDPLPIDLGYNWVGSTPYFYLKRSTPMDCDIVNLYEVVGAHAHIWDDGTVTTEPTCTETGVMTYTCTVDDCGETKTETIPATGHTWGEGVVTQEATCGEDGVKTYTCICDIEGCCGTDGVCNETKTEVIPATGEHTWDDGVVTKEATTAEEGVMTYTCTVCGETKTEPIPMLEAPAEDDDLRVTVEIHTDYVSGYSLIIVYGEAAGYLYGENAMYRTEYYDRKTEDGPTTAFAYIVSGTLDEDEITVTATTDPAPVITASYDVNGSGTVDIADVQAVADCYNGRGNLAQYMPVYLRADVNADHVVNVGDANEVLQNRT